MTGIYTLLKHMHRVANFITTFSVAPVILYYIPWCIFLYSHIAGCSEESGLCAVTPKLLPLYIFPHAVGAACPGCYSIKCPLPWQVFFLLWPICSCIWLSLSFVVVLDLMEDTASGFNVIKAWSWINWVLHHQIQAVSFAFAVPQVQLVGCCNGWC